MPICNIQTYKHLQHPNAPCIMGIPAQAKLSDRTNLSSVSCHKWEQVRSYTLRAGIALHKSQHYNWRIQVDESQKDWLESAYRTLQKAWREGDKNTTTVTFVPEELQALEDAIQLALGL